MLTPEQRGWLKVTCNICERDLIDLLRDGESMILHPLACDPDKEIPDKKIICIACKATMLSANPNCDCPYRCGRKLLVCTQKESPIEFQITCLPGVEDLTKSPSKRPRVVDQPAQADAGLRSGGMFMPIASGQTGIAPEGREFSRNAPLERPRLSQDYWFVKPNGLVALSEAVGQLMFRMRDTFPSDIPQNPYIAGVRSCFDRFYNSQQRRDVYANISHDSFMSLMETIHEKYGLSSWRHYPHTMIFFLEEFKKLVNDMRNRVEACSEQKTWLSQLESIIQHYLTAYNRMIETEGVNNVGPGGGPGGGGPGGGGGADGGYRGGADGGSRGGADGGSRGGASGAAVGFRASGASDTNGGSGARTGPSQTNCTSENRPVKMPAEIIDNDGHKVLNLCLVRQNVSFVMPNDPFENCNHFFGKPYLSKISPNNFAWDVVTLHLGNRNCIPDYFNTMTVNMKKFEQMVNLMAATCRRGSDEQKCCILLAKIAINFAGQFEEHHRQIVAEDNRNLG